jgi:ABC-type polysaccharide/polyol phosphate export permease
MFGIGRSDVAGAIADLRQGLVSFELWHLLAWNEVTQKYRRSLIGPWWLTLSLGITISAISVLFSAIYHLDVTAFLPNFCLGYIVWTMITTIVSEGCLGFIAFRSYIHQAKRPLTLYVLWIVWRNVIIFGHNLLIYIIAAVACQVWPGAALLMAPIGFLLMLAGVTWAAMLAGILAARYRDVPPIVQSALSIAFFITPILWLPEQLGRHQWLAYINPVTYLLEIVRGPLLGQVPSVQIWITALMIAVVGWIVTFLVLARFRKRVPYWL